MASATAPAVIPNLLNAVLPRTYLPTASLAMVMVVFLEYLEYLELHSLRRRHHNSGDLTRIPCRRITRQRKPIRIWATPRLLKALGLHLLPTPPSLKLARTSTRARWLREGEIACKRASDAGPARRRYTLIFRYEGGHQAHSIYPSATMGLHVRGARIRRRLLYPIICACGSVWLMRGCSRNVGHLLSLTCSKQH